MDMQAGLIPQVKLALTWWHNLSSHSAGPKCSLGGWGKDSSGMRKVIFAFYNNYWDIAEVLT